MPLFSAYSAMLKHAKPYIKNISGVFFQVFKSMKKCILICVTVPQKQVVKKLERLDL